MCCFYLSKLNFTTGCLSSTSKTGIYILGIEVSNVFMQGLLANGLSYTDACKCKVCNNNKRDAENDYGNLAQEEEHVYYDSDFSDNSECEYI